MLLRRVVGTRSASRSCRSSRLRHRPRARPVQLGPPPSQLPVEVAVGPPEVREADVRRVDRVQLGQQRGQLEAHGAQLVGGVGRVLRLVRQHGALDEVHHVEHRARARGRVLHQRDRRRHRHARPAQRGDDPVLAGHVVRGGLHVPERRPADDQGRRAAVDPVGEVAAPAGDHPRRQRTVAHRGRVLAAQVCLESRHVEPGRVRHASGHRRPPLREAPRHTARSVCYPIRRPGRARWPRGCCAGMGTGRRVASSTNTCTNRPSAITLPAAQDAELPRHAARPEPAGPQPHLERAPGTRPTP